MLETIGCEVYPILGEIRLTKGSPIDWNGELHALLCDECLKKTFALQTKIPWHRKLQAMSYEIGSCYATPCPNRFTHIVKLIQMTEIQFLRCLEE